MGPSHTRHCLRPLQPRPRPSAECNRHAPCLRQSPRSFRTQSLSLNTRPDNHSPPLEEGGASSPRHSPPDWTVGCQATRGGLPIGRAEHSIWLRRSQPEVIASLIGQGVVWWEGQRPPSHRACLRTQTEQPVQRSIRFFTSPLYVTRCTWAMAAMVLLPSQTLFDEGIVLTPVYLFIGKYVCGQHCAKTTEPICMKFSGMMCNVHSPKDARRSFWEQSD